MDNKHKPKYLGKWLSANSASVKRSYYLFLTMGMAFILLAAFLSSAAGSETTDFSLDPDGQAFEMYWGPENGLWVTDYGIPGDSGSSFPGAIWQIATETSVYTRYEVFAGAADAHVDNNGNVWWANTNLNTLNSLSLANSIAQSWPLTETIIGTPTGIDIDSKNNIWISGSGQTLVQRFDPGTNQLCAYDLPDYGKSLYILAHDGNIWLGDWVNHQILGLDPDTNQFKQWLLESNASPNGLTVDDDGNIWWTDVKDGKLDGVLGRLKPNLNLVTVYDASYSPFFPVMITHHDNKIWFTDGAIFANFGWLDPTADNGTTTIATSTTTSVVPRCTLPVIGSSIPITITTGTSTWQPTAIPLLENRQVDWSFYLLEGGSAGWGIAARDSNAWLVDRGHQRVVHLTFEECRQLTLSKFGLGEIPIATPDRSIGCKLGNYLPGEVIQLRGRPAKGFRVGKWSGTDNDRYTGLINQLTMPNMTHEVEAYYVEGYPIFLPFMMR